ncbi:CpsD/CapB family tyrosine-protein kinase [Gracilibacillus timonensis]|uniref:CpsD/CapB family tyrosine-protein kinase n=1 Tax=Gracilibacillus timonensis TaxID=1816696 RepID=UPI00082577D2|nr:CpsD/CapB family tyrosine-protein kinase [Gracilibacillus timonensis]
MLNKIRNAPITPIHLLTYSYPDSVIADQFREIRSNIQFLREKKNHSILLITSPEERTGKSTMAANLAVSLSQQNEKVLLIDANLRTPIMHSLFNLSNENGLSNVLRGLSTVKEAIRHTDIHQLDIITAGPEVFNPAEILESHAMKKLLDELDHPYDIVLIDSPSVLQTTETRVIANQCEGVVLVLKQGKTEIEKAIKTKQVLDLANANLIGAILN